MLIYGTGGHAKVIFDCLKSGIGEPEAFFDDHIREPVFLGKKVYNYSSVYRPDIPLVIAIGDNATRKRLSRSIAHAFGQAIHASVLISEFSTVGEGAMLVHHAVIQSHVKLGKHLIINTKASVDHDCVIGDYVHIGPGSTLCEGVNVGEGAFIGAGSVLLPRVKVGAWATIGAGSVVTRDVGERCVVMGNPAKVVGGNTSN